MTTSLLVAAFAMGFFGSPHCLGMCGGLVTAFGLSMQRASPAKKRLLIITYHFGRLVSYSFLGLMAGLIGVAVLQPVMVGNATPRILLGLVLVFIGLAMLGLPFLNQLEKVGMRFWQKLAPVRKKVFPLTTLPRALAAGLLWGFLPCGLVYGALLMAVAGHDAMTGAMLMFVFGLGTMPMLIATQEVVGWLHKQIGRFRLRQVNGVIMMLSGLAVIALPMVMSTMHGGHGGGHGAHGTHSAHSSTHANMQSTPQTNPHANTHASTPDRMSQASATHQDMTNQTQQSTNHDMQEHHH